MSFPAAPERIALPVQFCTVNVFAPLPAVRCASSIPASVSEPSPVSVVGESVKSTSADATTVSVPVPPTNASLPARPENVSSPARPESELSLEFPASVSASAVPVTFSIPLALESVSAKPATSVCAVVTARSIVTPPFNSPVKSSVSASVSAPSTIVTLADSVPVKT